MRFLTFGLKIFHDNVITQFLHDRLAVVFALKIRGSKVSWDKSEYIPQRHLIVVNLINKLRLVGDFGQVFVSPAVTRDLVTFCMHTTKYCCITSCGVVNCLCKIVTSDEESSFHLIAGKDVEDFVCKVHGRAIIKADGDGPYVPSVTCVKIIWRLHVPGFVQPCIKLPYGTFPTNGRGKSRRDSPAGTCCDSHASEKSCWQFPAPRVFASLKLFRRVDD